MVLRGYTPANRGGSSVLPTSPFPKGVSPLLFLLHRLDAIFPSSASPEPIEEMDLTTVLLHCPMMWYT